MDPISIVSQHNLTSIILIAVLSCLAFAVIFFVEKRMQQKANSFPIDIQKYTKK